MSERAIRRKCLLIALPPALAVAVLACQRQSQQEQSPATQPAAKLSAEQLEYARRPITYFNDKCGKCHGNYGSYWLEGVIAGLSEKKLRDVVDEMAAGPAQAPLEGLALEAQVAYHRSLADGKPFVTAFHEKDVWVGEVTPGSRVILIIEGREVAAEVAEHRWTSQARNASGIRVEKDENRTELNLKGLDAESALYSHAKPGR